MFDGYVQIILELPHVGNIADCFKIVYSVHFEYFRFRCQLDVHTAYITVYSLLLQHISA
jgi:hypothetical protein